MFVVLLIETTLKTQMLTNKSKTKHIVVYLNSGPGK